MRKFSIYTIVLLVLAGLITVYAVFNPAEHYFPKCPVYSFTGLKCSGCGSQRAIHHLLNFRFAESFREHPLLLPAIPYLILGAMMDNTRLATRWPRVRRIFFGPEAIWVVFFIIVIFTIVRNL